MRTTLQYLYSISVFMGVLACSYLMVKRDVLRPLPAVAEQPNFQFRSQAAVASNPALDQLFEVERELSEEIFRQQTLKQRRRKLPASLPDVYPPFALQPTR